MPLFNKTHKAVPADVPTASRQSADRTPSRQHSINSMNSTSSGDRRGSRTHAPVHFHQEEGPRPIAATQTSSRTRVGIPKAAYEQPKPSTPSGSVPGESRTAGDTVKDTCAYCGLGYAGCTALATYPAALAGGAAGFATGCGCGLLECGVCCIPRCFGHCLPPQNRRPFPYSRSGAGIVSGGVGCGLGVPCIAGPSIDRLEKSGKLSEQKAKRARNIVKPWKPLFKSANLSL